MKVRSTKYLLLLSFALIFGDVLFGTLGYMFIEGVSLSDALYMTVITISTVGYGEVVALSDAGRKFTIALISLNFGVVAYTLSVFSYLIVQGELFKYIFEKRMENEINKLDNHVILCGFGKYGKQIITNLRNHSEDFVIIDRDASKFERHNFKVSEDLFIEGDATHDEILIKAGIHRAKAVICALPRDEDNLFVVLTSRQLCPDIDIISKVINHSAESKLKLAGANHIVLPEQIGGYYMATLTTKPNSIEFLSLITKDVESDIDFGEITYDSIPNRCKGKTIQELNLRQETGINIIGFKDEQGAFHVNPEPTTVLSLDTSFIVIGSQKQIANLDSFLANM